MGGNLWTILLEKNMLWPVITGRDMYLMFTFEWFGYVFYLSMFVYKSIRWMVLHYLPVLCISLFTSCFLHLYFPRGFVYLYFCLSPQLQNILSVLREVEKMGYKIFFRPYPYRVVGWFVLYRVLVVHPSGCLSVCVKENHK